MLNRDSVAIVEPDPGGSGLYHSRLYTMPRGQKPIHQWIEKRDLPLRQQVAPVHEATRPLSRPAPGSKDAPWLAAPASEKQRETLKHLYPEEAERMERQPLTREFNGSSHAVKRIFSNDLWSWSGTAFAQSLVLLGPRRCCLLTRLEV